MKDEEILLEWAKTYGEDKDDVRASMYGVDLMIEFAKYYHTEQLRLGVVSQQRELLKFMSRDLITKKEINDFIGVYDEDEKSLIVANCTRI